MTSRLGWRSSDRSPLVGQALIVLFSSGREPVAAELAQRWARHGALPMTPLDLSRRGWILDDGCRGLAQCVVDGQRHSCGDISGVLVRATHVAAEDLGHIVEPERRYVAAEMTAFLIHWLTQLACPVLNRPCGGCLGGPGWHPEHWAVVAGRVGLDARPVRRRVGIEPTETGTISDGTCIVTVVGERAFGDGSLALHKKAIALARLARTDLVRFVFDDDSERLVSANPFPPPHDSEIEQAVLATLTGQ
jgi:hypothetical protein